MLRWRWRVAAGILALASTPSLWAVMGYCDVKQAGAKGDGVTNDTAAIQKVLDSCVSVKAPYGIHFGPGVYVSGPLVVRGNGNGISGQQWVMLEKGAVLRASTRRADWKAEGDGVQPLLRMTGGYLRLYGGGTIQSVGLKWGAAAQGAHGTGVDDPQLSRPAGLEVSGGYVKVEDVRFE